MGLRKKQNNVYILDFGVSKLYLNETDRTHIEEAKTNKFNGTL